MDVVSGRSLWQWRQKSIAAAVRVGVSATELDWLLRAVTDLDSLALRLETFQSLAEIQLQRSLSELTQLWQQRLEQRIPVQYLVGTTQWRHFTLQVSPAVLIPRPETELLIDLAVEQVSGFRGQGSGVKGQGSGEHRNTQRLEPETWNLEPETCSKTWNLEPETCAWADLGTGSGAIALGLAAAFPDATIHAVDWSAEALAIAQANAQAYSLQTRIQFYQGSWFEPLAHLQASLNGVVANPPYIPTALIPSLQPEVANHEPQLALDGGADGLDCIRHIAAVAPDYLKPGGIWLVETMIGQAPEVINLLEAQGCYCHIQVHADLAGIDRFVLAYRC